MPSTLSPAITLKTAYEIAFSPDGRRVAFIGGRDVTMLDISSRKTVFAVHPIANPSHIDFSPDGQCVVVKGTSGRTISLDAKTGRLLCDFRNQKEGEGDSAFFTACSRFVVTVSWGGLFSVRDRETAEVVVSESYGPPRSSDGRTPCTVALRRWPTNSTSAETLPKEWAAIWGLQISPSGRLLAVVYGTPPNTLEIYDITRSRIVAQCRWSGRPGCSIAWSRDEETLAVNGDECFRIYSVPTLRVVRELPAQYPCFVRFSPTEDFLALGSWKKSFIISKDALENLESGKRDA
jgi:WD40 repeat protein